MAELRETLIQRRLRSEVRSPRAAAIAGIIYSILMSIGMILTFNLTNITPKKISKQWLQSWSDNSNLVISLVPFAGIASLWFTGVVRDQLSYQEGLFFATIFFGCGIIQVILLFIWGAIFEAIMDTRNMGSIGLSSREVHIFGFALMNEIIGNYDVRMSGVYMTTIGALWGRTGSMPGWLTIITFVLAVGFLFGGDQIREFRFIFPAWYSPMPARLRPGSSSQTCHIPRGSVSLPIFLRGMPLPGTST